MKTKIKILFLSMGVTLSSCESWLERNPLDTPSVDTFYQSEAELQGGLNACYGFISEVNGGYNSAIYAFDAFTETVNNRAGFSIILGTHDHRDNLSTNAWGFLYQGVARCNLIISKLNGFQGTITETNRNQMLGEAHFMRGYYYLRLIQHFGDVIYTEAPVTTVSEGLQLGRTSKDEVYQKIQEDFTIAADKLENSTVTDLGRATWGSAIAYKVRAALYQGEWDTVISEAEKLMKSNKYELYPSYEKLFTEEVVRGANNKEEIFSFDYDLLSNRTSMFITYAGNRAMGGWSTVTPTQNLVDSYECIDGKYIDESPLFDKAHPYENRDPRLRYTCVVPGDWWYGDNKGLTMVKYETHKDSLTTINMNGDVVKNADCYTNSPYTSFTGYLFRKYINPAYFANMNKDETPFMLCRYAEVLLSYAEAKIEKNQIDENCLNAINSIRQRADVNMPPIPAGLSQAEMRKVVRHERKIELANENLRLQDLRRWKRMEVIMNKPMLGRPVAGAYTDYPDVTFDEFGDPIYDVANYVPHPSSDYRIITNLYFNKDRDYLWGIPEKDMTLNPNLTQNPGY